MRPHPDAQVLSWLAARDACTLFLTAVTEAELQAGVALLPGGKRGEALGAALEAIQAQNFAGRMLPFEGGAAARAYAAIQANRRRSGRPIAMADALIAAIARACGMQLATRNVDDFVDTGVAIVNP